MNREAGSERSGELTAKFVSDEGKSDAYEDREKLGDGNCFVLEGLDREGFWEVVLECVEKAEKVVDTTPL